MRGIIELLQEEIKEQGAIPFCRFMELALYAPDAGYYERERPVVGRAGDFITSVAAGRVFGDLLACQFLDWAEAESKGPLTLVEAGAHDGVLAGDILSWFRKEAPEFVERVHYVVVEPSERRRTWQEATLEDFAGQVSWVEHLEGIREGVEGVIFSNELLDAFPVRRLGWDGGEWFEWGVTIESGRLGWTRLAMSGGTAAALLEGCALGSFEGVWEVLPPGFTIDLCPAAGAWWRRAAGCLRRGRLMTIDYGLEAAAFFAPERRQGTLRGYRRHALRSDLLADPGEQDLTAHVNFTQLLRAGEGAGLRTEQWVSQERFLMGIAQRRLADRRMSEWGTAERRQLMTLCHPERFGAAFKVLVQVRL